MKARLADMPVMAQRPDTIEAKIFNLWRRARQTVPPPLQITLPGLKTMRFILADSYWVVADSANYYVPVVAWLNFDTSQRTDIHSPIACNINYYHFAASAVRAKSLALVTTALEEMLAGDSKNNEKSASIHQLSSGS
jgi:hypothetical protein